MAGSWAAFNVCYSFRYHGPQVLLVFLFLSPQFSLVFPKNFSVRLWVFSVVSDIIQLFCWNPVDFVVKYGRESIILY